MALAAPAYDDLRSVARPAPTRQPMKNPVKLVPKGESQTLLMSPYLRIARTPSSFALYNN